MTREEFIMKISAYVQKYAPQYGISVCSPIIAQAILESASGTSNKVFVVNEDGSTDWRHNYFGLKYRDNRCPSSNGWFDEKTSEQNKDGSYTNIVSRFFRFPDMESGVKGYFEFVSISNYANLKGVTDPREYLKRIKEDKYATSIDYVENVMAVVNSYGLTRYDLPAESEETMSIKIVENIATQNPCYKAERTITPKGGMLHSVGCPQPDPLAFVKTWQNSNAKVCVHAVVGKDAVVYQMLPWNRRAWHCGSGAKGSGNDTLISLEMTEPASIKYTGGSSWIETGSGANTKSHVLATYANAVQFFAFICNQYGFNPESSNVLMSHSEGNKKGIASAHGDVEHIWRKFGLTMDQFRKDVRTAMGGGAVSTVPDIPVDTSRDDTSGQKVNPLDGSVTVIYTGADGLNVRKAPSITAAVDRIVHEGKFTVVGISADEKWYRLKSGLYITTIPDYVKFKATPEQKESTAGTGYYRVRQRWDATGSQIGAFKKKENAIDLCRQNAGYRVFGPDGKEVYPCVTDMHEEFLVRITKPDEKIRKGPGTGFDYHKKSGKPVYTGAGTFTIVKTMDGPGAKRWGLLKYYSGKEDGWIPLDDFI